MKLLDQGKYLIMFFNKLKSYVSRNEKKPLSRNQIKEKLLKSKQDERKIATERNTLTIHYRKWETFELNTMLESRWQGMMIYP